MTRPSPACAALAVAAAAGIGVLDSRASEVQPAVLLILVASAAFAFWHPARSGWWIAIFGSSIVATAVVQRAVGVAAAASPEPTVFAGFIALVPAALGAGAGAFLRLVSKRTRI